MKQNSPAVTGLFRFWPFSRQVSSAPLIDPCTANDHMRDPSYLNGELSTGSLQRTRWENSPGIGDYLEDGIGFHIII